jgi:hypothetical protein
MSDSTYTVIKSDADSLTIEVTTTRDTVEARIAFWMDGYTQAKADYMAGRYAAPEGKKICVKAFSPGQESDMYRWLREGDEQVLVAHGVEPYKNDRSRGVVWKRFVKYYVESETGMLTYEELSKGMEDLLGDSKVSDSNRVMISACWVDENLGHFADSYELLQPAPGVCGLNNVDQKAFEAVGASLLLE